MDKSLIGTSIALGISFIIMYSRKEKWLNPKIVWLTLSGLCIIGVIGLIKTNAEFKDNLILFYGFCVPLIYWIFDRIFKLISLRIQKRDFYLWLRNSDEIDNQLFAKNPHVKITDKILSFGLLIIIIAALLVGIEIIK